MDCLKNRIGILGCDTNKDGVKLFVNQLPGISIDNISALADDEQITYFGVWEDIVLRTLLKFEILVRKEINKCYSITNKETIECLICENADLFDASLWYLHGVELMIERTSTDRLNRYTTVDFDKAEKLKEDYYIEVISLLEASVKSIDIIGSMCIDSSDCVDCNGSVRWKFQIP